MTDDLKSQFGVAVKREFKGSVVLSDLFREAGSVFDFSGTVPGRVVLIDLNETEKNALLATDKVWVEAPVMHDF